MVLPVFEFLDMYSKALDSKLEMKCAFLMMETFHLELNAEYKTTLGIMNNEVTRKPLGLAMGSNHVLYHRLNHLLDQLIQTGIPNHLYELGLWLWHRQLDMEVEDPRKILTMQMLEFGFVFWLAACCLSFFVFLSEIISLWFKKHAKDIIGAFAFTRLLKLQVSHYHDKWPAVETKRKTSSKNHSVVGLT